MVSEYETRIPKWDPPLRPGEEFVHPPRSPNIRPDISQDDNIRMPRSNVSRIPQIGLINTVSRDCEVEHLNLRPQFALKLIRPGLFITDLVRECERISDEGNTIGAGTISEDRTWSWRDIFPNLGLKSWWFKSSPQP